MKKPLSLLLIFLFTIVSLAAWDCGCAFAGTHQKVQEAKEVASCHHASEKTPEEKEKCCPKNQLNEKAPTPSPLKILMPKKALQILFPHLLDTDSNSLPLHTYQNSTLFSSHRLSSNLPVYLMTQSLLI